VVQHHQHHVLDDPRRDHRRGRRLPAEPAGLT
jgi:hypothetical protein